MTLNEASKLLPVNSTWSCIFGSYGEPGCNEYWTAPNGDKWILHNEPAPFGNVHNWNARKD